MATITPEEEELLKKEMEYCKHRLYPLQRRMRRFEIQRKKYSDLIMELIERHNRADRRLAEVYKLRKVSKVRKKQSLLKSLESLLLNKDKLDMLIQLLENEPLGE